MKLFEIAQQEHMEDEAILFYKKEIEPNCHQYLQLVGEKELYRGMSKLPPFGKFTTHPNRKPKDTNIIYHNAVDDMFEDEIGIRIRSGNALFTTPAIRHARSYGVPYVIFVPDNVNYTYLNGIQDLTAQLLDYTSLGVEKPNSDDVRTKSPRYLQMIRNNIQQHLAPRIRHNRDINVAFDDDCEVIFTTPTYYAISNTLWTEIN
jgi:hypothetical protein